MFHHVDHFLRTTERQRNWMRIQESRVHDDDDDDDDDAGGGDDVFLNMDKYGIFLLTFP